MVLHLDFLDASLYTLLALLHCDIIGTIRKTKGIAMAQKKSHTHASAKLASNKNAKPAFVPSAVRESAEKVVRLGNDAVKDFFATSAEEAQKTQEKVCSISRDSAENMAKSADAMSKTMYETMSASRDNIETCIECGNISAAMVKDLSTEVFENANRMFSDNVEMAKDLFACRTINDMMEMGSRYLRQNYDNFFSQSASMSGMAFEYASDLLEPVNERVEEMTSQFSKAVKA